MREPRTYGERHQWCAPEGYGIKVDEPIAGYYKFRFGRDTVLRAVWLHYGPPVDPVTGEEMDRSWRWMATIDDGSLADFTMIWPACARTPIDQREWHRCCNRTAWAREHAPDSAYAQRGRRVDPLSLQSPLPF